MKYMGKSTRGEVGERGFLKPKQIMEVNKTLISEIQRQQVLDEWSSQWYDLFIHLFFHKRVSDNVIRETIDKWDGVINRRILGRRFHLPKFQDKRIRFIGTIEESDNGNSHVHLLVKFPLRDRMETFKKELESSFQKVWNGGEVGIIQESTSDIVDDFRRERNHIRNNGGVKYISFTPNDIKQMVDYILKEYEGGDRDTLIISRVV